MEQPSKKSRYKRMRGAKASVGSSPGTMVIDPDAPKPKIVALCYTPDHVVEETVEDLSRIPLLLNKWPVVWIQVIGLGDKATLQKLGDIFKLHRLTLEDVTNLQQRPKIELYGEQFFIIARMMESAADFRNSHQISLFLEKNFVLSFQERDVQLFEPLKNRIRNRLGRVRFSGPDYLTYAMIDCIIDQYFPVLESVAERLDELETTMFTVNRAKILTDLHALRHDLLAMRRAMWPLRDVINNMIRDPAPIFTQETRIHLRDCYDHSVQIVDLVESYRELSASLMELSISLMSHRLNEGIRILTVISTIFIPLNFIAGVYGMNFHTEVSWWNMPELKWTYGYPFALALMGSVAGVQMYLFWSRGWLKENKGG